jgi:hypothetical protein
VSFSDGIITKRGIFETKPRPPNGRNCGSIPDTDAELPANTFEKYEIRYGTKGINTSNAAPVAKSTFSVRLNFLRYVCA